MDALALRSQIVGGFACLLLLCSVVSLNVTAQDANAGVNPMPATAEVGDTFTVTVNIDPNGSGITVAQVAMDFDPTIVQINTVSLSPSSSLNVGLPGTTIDNVTGFFFIAGFGFAPATVPFDHVEIEFEALSNGVTTLDFITEGVLATLFAAGGNDQTGLLNPGEIIIGDLVDCPNLNANIGDTCDDGDANTENDMVLPDCTCEGTPICQQPFPAVDQASKSTVILPNEVLFFWDAVDGQIGCQVQVARALGNPFQRQSFTLLDANVNSFSLNSNLILPGILHGWRVRCGCSASPVVAGPFTQWLTFTLPSQISISSQPNPTSDLSKVQFSIPYQSMVSVEVFDLNGKLIQHVFEGMAFSETSYSFDFDGSELEQGIYIYRLTTENEVVNEKFIITR